jgi:hypothetical protein
MNSDSNNISQNIFEIPISKDSDNLFNSNMKEEDKKEKDELKNLRVETSLSLRKQKINEILLFKRKKQIIDKSNNKNSDDNEVFIDKKEMLNNTPKILLEEFDNYDEKLTLIHQFLNNDFTVLHEIPFNKEYLKQYVIFKLMELSFEDNSNIYESRFEKDLTIVFHDIIKMINECDDKKIIFGTTTCVVNLIYYSNILSQELKKINIWKRLGKISELKQANINDNIFAIMINVYANDLDVGKEFILSNYSRYIKQILINFFETFLKESNKDKIDLDLYIGGIVLITRLIRNENQIKKKNNEFDVVVKMKYTYEYATKMFVTASSWIINNVASPEHNLIFKLISKLMELFSEISTYVIEDNYQMQDFRGESFVSSFCSLVKYLISNKEKRIPIDHILNTLSDLYNFIGIFFSIGYEKTEIYIKNKFLVITEDFSQNINNMNKNLANKILFFISNFLDNDQRVKDIFEESNFLLIIKDYANKNIMDNKICFNIYCIIENGFFIGNNNCKEIIISNFSNFLIQRIKILSELIIKDQKENEKYLKYIIDKCNLILSSISFLRHNSNTNLELLKYLLDYIKISNIEPFLENIQNIAKKERDIEIIDSFLKEIKNK